MLYDWISTTLFEVIFKNTPRKWNRYWKLLTSVHFLIFQTRFVLTEKLFKLQTLKYEFHCIRNFCCFHYRKTYLFLKWYDIKCYTIPGKAAINFTAVLKTIIQRFKKLHREKHRVYIVVINILMTSWWICTLEVIP